MWTLCWALLGTVLAAWLALVPLEGVPHVQDEVVYTLQARALAAGGLGWASPEPLALESFHFLLDVDGRRFGVFPPGWPAVLAAGVWMGAPWLINALLHGVCVLLGTALAGRFGGEMAVRVTPPLLALSPGLLLLAGSRMAHTWTALLVLAGLGLSLQNGRRHSVALGGCLGLLVLTRPLDALVLGIVVLPGLLRQGVGVGAWAAIGPALGLGLLGAVNLAVTGDVLVLPQAAYFAEGLPPVPDPAFRYGPDCNALGFGAQIGCFPTYGDLGHTPAKALLSTTRNLEAAGRLWLGHGVLLLLAGGAWWRPQARPLLFRGLALGGLLILGYGLYWVPGLAYGPRFLHSLAPVWIVLCALGVAVGLERRPSLPWIGALVLLLPMGGRLASALPELVGYWGVDGRFASLEQRWEGPDALLLVAYSAEGGQVLEAPQTLGTTLTAPPRLWRGAWLGRGDGPILYAEFQPALVDVALAAHPGREGWLYVMHLDPAQDQLIPLDRLDRSPQAQALPMPVDPFTMSPLPVAPVPGEGPLP